MIKEEEKGKVGVAYIRTSQDDKESPRESIRTQESIIKEHAKQNGDEIVKIYRDIGKSGTKIKGRSEFIQMKKDALDEKFERIYILKLSRFARDIVDQELEIRSFIKQGISIYCVEDGGLLEEKETLLRVVKGGVSEEEVRRMREATEFEHSLRLKKKIPISRPPMGYRMNYKMNPKGKKIPIDKSKEIHSWIIDIEEKEIITKIFELKSSGISEKEVSERLSIPLSKIKYVIRNKAYLGYYRYRDKLIEMHEPIISEELFNKCQ